MTLDSYTAEDLVTNLGPPEAADIRVSADGQHLVLRTSKGEEYVFPMTAEQKRQITACPVVSTSHTDCSTHEHGRSTFCKYFI